MNFRSIPIFACLLSCLSFAGPKVEKGVSPKRRIASEAQIQVAKSNFSSFLKCGSSPQAKNEQFLIDCMQRFLTSEAGLQRAHYYEFIFLSRMKVTDLRVCEAAQADLVQNMEDSAYDLFLCFTTDYLNPPATGIVFFQSEGVSLKISKIKL